jgi:hypothetical protein
LKDLTWKLNGGTSKRNIMSEIVIKSICNLHMHSRSVKAEGERGESMSVIENTAMVQLEIALTS